MLAGGAVHRVRAAYEQYLAGWDANGAEWDHWVERAETARAAFARLLGATPSEVAVTTSVSQGVSGIVSALDLTSRPRIVISEYEFPTIGQIAHAQELRGAEMVHVRPEADGSIPLERWAEAIDERTALVCCTAISYRTGHRPDIAAVAALARAEWSAGARRQLSGCWRDRARRPHARRRLRDRRHREVSARLGGPRFPLVRGGLLPDLVPTQTGWFADEDIFRMDISDYSPAPDARRFDAGTPPVPNIYAGVAGMSIIEEVGIGAIEAHVRGLNTRLIERLEELGASVATPRDPAGRGPLVCVRSTDAPALVAELATERIVVSYRDENIRVAAHLYSTEEDVDWLLQALETRRHLLV